MRRVEHGGVLVRPNRRPGPPRAPRAPRSPPPPVPAATGRQRRNSAARSSATELAGIALPSGRRVRPGPAAGGLASPGSSGRPRAGHPLAGFPPAGLRVGPGPARPGRGWLQLQTCSASMASRPRAASSARLQADRIGDVPVQDHVRDAAADSRADAIRLATGLGSTPTITSGRSAGRGPRGPLAHRQVQRLEQRRRPRTRRRRPGRAAGRAGPRRTAAARGPGTARGTPR